MKTQIPSMANGTRRFQIAAAVFMLASIGLAIALTFGYSEPTVDFNGDPSGIPVAVHETEFQETNDQQTANQQTTEQQTQSAEPVVAESAVPESAATEPAENSSEQVERPLITERTDSASADQSAAQPGGEAVVETITFGGGCFWCTEAVFQELEGVLTVQSGYCNGLTENPTYHDVCTGTTGYAEVIQITYDPSQIEFATLLEVFFKTHDPTTLNRQGVDTGTQYRSGVFYHTEAQRELSALYVRRLNELGAYNSPIVTEVTQISDYYPAEDYHQNYFRANPNQGYCQGVIRPKMDKFRQAFADKLKTETPVEARDR